MLSGTLVRKTHTLRICSSWSRFVATSSLGGDEVHIIRSSGPDLEIPSPCPNFNDFICENFAKYGDRAAIIVANPDGSRDTRTFTELLADIDSVAAELKTQLGFGQWSTAMLVSPNHADYFTSVHAVLRLGGALSPANPLYTAGELARQLEDSGAELLIAHPMCLGKALEAVALAKKSSRVSSVDEESSAKQAGKQVKVLVLGDDASGIASGIASGAVVDPFGALKGTGGRVASAGCVADDTLAVLPYSSGTAGLPKGTVLTHRNLVANVLQFEQAELRFWDRTREVLVSPLPFFHIYGFTASLNCPLWAGSPCVTMPAFDLERFLGLVQEYGCTKAHLVPPIVLGLAKHPAVDHFDTSSLKTIISGAAPLGKEVAAACSARLGGCVVKQAWGMSELSPIGTLCPDDDPRGGSSGPPVAGMEYKVLCTETGAALPRGEEGEVVCRGPNVMRGYLNNPRANAESFIEGEGGWFRTGDIGYFDADGFVFFTDRLKELIKYKGFQVAPAELEALLLTHQGLLDAAVVARADAGAGELPVAFLVPKPGAVEAAARAGAVEAGAVADSPSEAAKAAFGRAVAAWVAARVAPHKKLRGGVVVVDAIPKSASGKILRRLLVDRDRAGEFAEK